MQALLCLLIAAPITPPTTPDSTTNAYTVIRDAIVAAHDGDTLTLSGHFDFTEANALASWTTDSYQLAVPDGLANITLTAASLGDAIISGPGDIPSYGYDAFLYFGVGHSNPGWTISNLQIESFDSAIFFEVGAVNAFHDLTVANNLIKIPSDVPGNGNSDESLNPEITQNLGVLLGSGYNQTVQNNNFEIDGTGASGTDEQAKIYVFQTQNTDTDAFDGLQVLNNHVLVKGTPAERPARIYGFLDNNNDSGAAELYQGNVFESEVLFQTKANAEIAFLPTTQSPSGAKQVIWKDNVSIGARRGFGTFDRYDISPFGNSPIIFQNNTCIDDDTGMYITYDYDYDITGLTAIGGRVGIDANAGRTVQVSPRPVPYTSTINVSGSTFSGQTEAAVRSENLTALSVTGTTFHALGGLAFDNLVDPANVPTQHADGNSWDNPDPAVIAGLIHGAVTLGSPTAQTSSADTVTVAKLASVDIPFTGSVTVVALPAFGTLSSGGNPVHRGDTVSATVTYTRAASHADTLWFTTAGKPTPALVSLTNAAPVFAGTPVTEASVGAMYTFASLPTDANMDTLLVTAMGLPAWLTLDAATGALSGTAPAAAETDNIVLTVSDGSLSATLPVALAVSVPAPTGSTGATGTTSATGSTAEMGATGSTDATDMGSSDLTPDQVMQARGSGCKCHASAADDSWLLFAAVVLLLRRRKR